MSVLTDYELVVSVFPASTGSDITGAITTALTDNLGPVLLVFGFMVGLAWIFKLLRKSAKGSI
jgi:hypothetical protein